MKNNKLKIIFSIFFVFNMFLFSIDVDSLKIELNSSDDIKKIELLNQLSKSYKEIDSKKSIKYAESALALAKQLKIVKGQLEASLILAENYLKNGDFTELKELSIRSIELATEIEDNYYIGKFNHLRGDSEKRRGKLDIALKFYFISLRIWKQEKNDLETAKELRSIGDLYKSKAEYENSLKYLIEALKISEENNEKASITDIYGVIGQVYYYLSNNKEALFYHKKSLSIALELGLKQSTAIAYSNIGMVLLADEKLDDAIINYEKALKIDIEIDDKIGQTIEYNNLGIIYTMKGEYEKALNYYHLSLKIEKKNENNIGIAQTLNNIGKIYLKTGELARSLKITKEAYDILVKEQAPEALMDVNLELSMIYLLKGNYKKGNYHLESYITSKDSLYNREMRTQISAIKTKYEFEKKEKQIFSLIRDGEIKKLEIDKQKLIKNIFIGAFFLVTILLLTIYKFYLLKVQSNKKINVEKTKALLELEKRVAVEKVLRQSQIDIEGLNKSLENEISKKKDELNITSDRLKESEKILIRQEKLVSLGTMLAGIAHEIKNPVQAISFSLDGLSLNIKDINSFIKETLKLSENKAFSSDDKLSIILGLIDQYELGDIFNEIDTFILENKKTVGMIENIVSSTKKLSYSNISFTTFNINEILRDSLNLVSNQVRYTAKIDLDLGEDLPKVTGLYQELGQVFINLLINAKDAIIDKKIKQADAVIKIETSFVKEVNKILVKITDNGIGIESENMDKIFEPFFTTKKLSKGTGLGLNIVKRIIESHHGKIELRSVLNEGSTFFIYLPV